MNKNISIFSSAVSQTKTAAPRSACRQTCLASARKKSIARAVRSTAGVAIATAALYVTEASAAGIDSIEIGTASAPGDVAVAIGAEATASGNSSLAIGWQANAQNDDAIAVGTNATAQGDGAVTVGLSSSAQGEGASAVGMRASAQAQRATAIGLDASALGVDSVATGSGSIAANPAASAFGSLSTATSVGSTALGYLAQAGGTNSLAAGAWASALEDSSVALGSNALASGIGAIALGVAAQASGAYAGAIGSGATAAGAGAIALGNNANASADHSVALGANSSTVADLSQSAFAPVGTGVTPIAGARPTGEVSLGSANNERRLTNVAAGAAPTDAVNVSQLSAVDGKVDALAQSGALHYFSAYDPVDGSNDALADGTHALAVGSNASATGTDATAFGTSASARAMGSTAIGAGAVAAADSALAIGYNASALAANSVALGQGSIADRAGTVSVGSPGNERQITNVAAGTADTDAVNVAQLKAVSDQNSATAAKLDGAVMYDTNADGSINRNSVTLGGDTTDGTVIHNVADGVQASDAVNLGQLNAALEGAINNAAIGSGSALFTAAGESATESAQASGSHAIAAGANAQASGANAIAAGANAVASGNNATAVGAAASASADNSVALGQGSVADRANTVSVGAAGQERQITNVAAGVRGTDAVNVNQLQQGVSGAISEANRYTDDQIRSARRDSYGGTAAALAMAGLPQAVLPGHGMVAMAGGTYGGQSALAISVSQLSDTGKWIYKVQGSTDSRGQFGASIGVGMHW
ncbi:YadA domain protein [Burkholderia sp. H160]|nr:YadA domain protein [Burkholderia sp. H160]